MEYLDGGGIFRDDFRVLERNRKMWIAIGVVLICALSAFFWSLGRRSESGAKPEQASASGNERLSAMKNSLGSALSRQNVTIEPAERIERKFDPYEEWETVKILEHFGIPSAKFEGETMPEVIELIREMFEEYGGKNVEFQILGGGDAGYPVVADIDENISLRVLLDLVAGLGGYDLDLTEGLVTFRRKALTAVDNQLQTMRLAAVPDMMEPQGIVADPFADSPELKPSSSPSEWFSKYGIQFEAGAGIEIDSMNGEWVLTNVGVEVARARAVYEFAAAKVPGSLPGGMVHFAFKNVGEDGGADFEAQTFADTSDFEEAMRVLGDNAKVNSSPVILTNVGQRAKVEIGREVIYSTERDASGTPTSFEMRMVGFSTEVEARVAGLDRVLMAGSSEYTTMGEMELKDLLRSDGEHGNSVSGGKPPNSLPAPSEDAFRSHLTDFEGAIIDGNTVGFSAAKDGSSDLLQFITARRILPDGTPLLPE